MKTIQGKVLFGVIPIFNNGLSISAFKQACDLLVSDTKIHDSFRLSEITEQQACELVDCLAKTTSGELLFFRNYERGIPQPVSMTFCTAKESLVSLLKANDCWIKEWKEIPLSMYYSPEQGCQKHPQECYKQDLEDYNNIPDDWLVVRLYNE